MYVYVTHICFPFSYGSYQSRGQGQPKKAFFSVEKEKEKQVFFQSLKCVHCLPVVLGGLCEQKRRTFRVGSKREELGEARRNCRYTAKGDRRLR